MTRGGFPTSFSLPYALLAVLMGVIVIIPPYASLSFPTCHHCCCHWPSPCIVVIVIVHRPFDLQRPHCCHLVGALLVIGHQSSPTAFIIIIHHHCAWREGKGGGQCHPSPTLRHHCCCSLVGEATKQAIHLRTTLPILVRSVE